jgi:P-type Ca2+ transporter type 2C
MNSKRTDHEEKRDGGRSPFALSPDDLATFLDPKSVTALEKLGGLQRLEHGLRTDRRSGLSIDETTFDDEPSGARLQGKDRVSSAESTGASNATPLSRVTSKAGGKPLPLLTHQNDQYADRKRIFGEHRLPDRESKSFLQLAWIALQDRVLILLSIAAAVSLALGLYQTFGSTHHEDGARIEWVEGVAIIVAITIVVIVSALNDWQKERQFRRLNQKKEDRSVKVVRSGKPVRISVHDILVGDVMILEQGDVLPVDGVFIEGHNISCDEASATGESDLVKKTPADTVSRLLKEEGPHTAKLDPFLLSGAKVLDGVGTFLVTAVGQHSLNGKTMMSLRDDPGLTPLQAKLNILAGKLSHLVFCERLALTGL